MKYFKSKCLLAILISALLISCNQTEIEKIGLDNRLAQRQFQDSILLKDTSNPEIYFENLRYLISSYRILESDKLNKDSNYIYYLARLYNRINSTPIEYFYNSKSKSFRYRDIYKIMYDSALFYSRKLIEQNPSNYIGYYYLAESMVVSWARHNTDTLNVPYEFKSDNLESRKGYVNLLKNNIENVYAVDTTSDKFYAKYVEEATAIFKVEEYAPYMHGVTMLNQLKTGPQKINMNLGELDDSKLSELKSFENLFRRLLTTKNYVLNATGGINSTLKFLSSLNTQIESVLVEKYFYSSGNDFFLNKIFDMGTAHLLKFDSNHVTLSIERYYDGVNRVYSIEGIYKINSANTLKIEWNKSNSISFKNILGATCGSLQEVNQTYIFSDIITLNASKKTLNINSTFKQSFSAGTRCGDEDKKDNSSWEFQLSQ